MSTATNAQTTATPAGFPVIDQDRCLELIREVQAGVGGAEGKLMELCLPLIMRMARSQSTRAMPPEEFISEGAIALLQAAKGYNLDSTVPFTAYAATWIRHAMRHAARDSHQTIRLSGRTRAKLNRVWAAARKIENTTGRRPSAREIAQLARLSVAEVHEALERRGAVVLSIDQPRAGQDAPDVLAGPLEPAAPSTEDNSRTSSWIEALLRTMPLEERTLVVRRFGLDSSSPATIRDLSRSTGMAPRMVRSALDRAMHRLRAVATRA
ncbi:MAG: hypothetical protein AMXMBFR58_30350 [Phycisphaerae bacterium]|nr:RNA polymerase sigma factor RpoS [Phycisphaerales bacterium]MCK6476033.1 sigma-70 family RNA polymerase sigma factor [Phycisphaerales bacterium]